MKRRPVVALAGGVGAARFLRGLVQVVRPSDLTVIVNTGDDRDFYGLRVCPDLDTITYTLANRVRRDVGWGIEGDSFQTLAALRRFEREAWFQLGDQDLATHIHRTRRLQQGASLAEVTAEIARAFELEVELLPMTCDPAATAIEREDGSRADFEEYLVRDGAPDDVRTIDLSQARCATPGPAVLEAIQAAESLLVCPSNPLVSIGTILAVPGIQQAVDLRRDAVAVSPLIGGRPVKGPADRLMRAVQVEVSSYGVATLYRSFVRGLIIDDVDAALTERIEQLGIAVRTRPTLMKDSNVSRDLAASAMEFAKELC